MSVDIHKIPGEKFRAQMYTKHGPYYAAIEISEWGEPPYGEGLDIGYANEFGATETLSIPEEAVQALLHMILLRNMLRKDGSCEQCEAPLPPAGVESEVKVEVVPELTRPEQYLLLYDRDQEALHSSKAAWDEMYSFWKTMTEEEKAEASLLLQARDAG